MWQNIETENIPPAARIVLSPINPLAQGIGQVDTMYLVGNKSATVSQDIPDTLGSYQYTFQPQQVTIDPETGEENWYSVGYPVQFMVIIGEKETVSVTSS